MSGAGFALPRLHFGFGQRLPLVLQGEAAECGLACLAMVAGYHGYRTDLLSLRRRFTVGLRGSTLKGVMDIASALALSSRPIRIELGDLPQLPTPCLLHWNLNHFVVLKKVLRKGGGAPAGIVVHDPARGQLTLSMAEVSASFTGVVLELTPTPGFRREEDKQRISLRQMMGSATGLKRSLAQIFVLALALEAFALVGPFFMTSATLVKSTLSGSMRMKGRATRPASHSHSASRVSALCGASAEASLQCATAHSGCIAPTMFFRMPRACA